MKKWPKFNKNGDLPAGIHKASLSDVIEHFGERNFKRAILAQRLRRIYDLVVETGQAVRYIIFGSFITDKPNPQNLDIFLINNGLVTESEGRELGTNPRFKKPRVIGKRL